MKKPLTPLSKVIIMLISPGRNIENKNGGKLMIMCIMMNLALGISSRVVPAGKHSLSNKQR